MKYLNIFVVLIAVAAIAGGYIFPIAKSVSSFGAASPVSTTFGTQRTLAVTANLANSTSTSVQNTNAYDVYATELQYQCSGVGTSQTAGTGAGLASITLKAATTSTSNVGNTSTSNTAVSNTNLIVSTTLATSSANTIVASTTPSIAGNIALNDDIPPNSYVTFFTNATNTAVCNFGVQIIGS